MAELGEVSGLLQKLCQFHGKGLPPEALAYYGEALAKFSLWQLQDAFNQWREEHSPSERLPSLAQLKACIEQARARQWKVQKDVESRNPVSELGLEPLDPAYLKARWDLVKRAFRMTKQQLIEAFEDMHRQYPGHDWDGAARRLKASCSQLIQIEPGGAGPEARARPTRDDPQANAHPMRRAASQALPSRRYAAPGESAT